MDKIETRGGSRPGCGRKPVHPGIKRVQTTISVSQKTRERIRVLAKKKTIRCRAKVTASSATVYWLYGVSSSGTLYGHSEYGWSSGVSGIPSGWEFVELTD